MDRGSADRVAPKTLRYSIFSPPRRRLFCTDCSPIHRHLSLLSLVCISLFFLIKRCSNKTRGRDVTGTTLCVQKKRRERQCVNSGGGICRHFAYHPLRPPPPNATTVTPSCSHNPYSVSISSGGGARAVCNWYSGSVRANAEPC